MSFFFKSNMLPLSLMEHFCSLFSIEIWSLLEFHSDKLFILSFDIALIVEIDDINIANIIHINK